MQILVQNAEKPEQKQRLSFYHQHVEKLVEKLDLNAATEKDILLSIFQADKNISITFDTLNYKVTDVESLIWANNKALFKLGAHGGVVIPQTLTCTCTLFALLRVPGNNK